MNRFRNVIQWVNREICSVSLLVPCAALIAVMFALPGCSGKSNDISGINPGTTPPPTTAAMLAIAPTSATLTPGASKTFSATGGISSTYSWSLLSGGGTLAATTGNVTTFTAGSVAGTYTVQVQNGSVTASAVVTVNAISPTPTPTPTPTPVPGQNSLVFVSADPPPGSTLKVGDMVKVTVTYNVLQSGSAILVDLPGIAAHGSGPVVTAGTGTARPQITANTPGTSTILRVTIEGPKGGIQTTLDVPAPYTWWQ